MVGCRDVTPAGATFRAIKVGEYFDYPAKPGESIDRVQRRACGMFCHFKPKRFASRRMVVKGHMIVRVWRIA